MKRTGQFILRNEPWFLALMFLIALFQVWATRFVPSLDGPQHLYNAQVIDRLVRGDEAFRQFFSINEVIVGYWTGHFLLSLLHFFLPGWLAEKLFLSLYIFGMYFSFRYLVRSVNPEKGNLIIYLIFPFIFHTYLLRGYYSFSFAILFYFLAIGFWIRKGERLSAGQLLVFSLLMLGVFLSHGLVFAIFCVSLLGLFLFRFIQRTGVAGFSVSLKEYLTGGLKILLAALPSLVLWYIYISSVMGIDDTVTKAKYSFGKLWIFLLRAEPLVGFDYKREMYAYILLSALILSLLAVLVLDLIRKRKSKETVPKKDTGYRNLLLPLVILFLLVYLFAPDRISAGNLTNRFGLFFFLLLIAWLAQQHFRTGVKVASLAVLLLVCVQSRYIHHGYLKILNTRAKQFTELGKLIPEGSTLTGIRESGNWIDHHFFSYTADQAGAIYINNQQCAGQFPVVWNNHDLPEVFAGTERVSMPGSVPEPASVHEKRELDFIVVYDDRKFWSRPEYVKWQNLLDAYYTREGSSNDGAVVLYRRTVKAN
ncbi:MAG: hypothetical protein ACOYXB_01980 [Bacteroidota bacterium]